MNLVRSLTTITLMVASVSGCSGSDSVFHGISIIDSAHVAVHAHAVPDARVNAGGTLEIGGKAVALTPSQQRLTRDYFASVMALHADAIATGKAGLQTAHQVLGSLAAAMSSGNTRGLDRAIDAKTAAVDRSANRVCRDLSAIRKTQDAIAASLPAFRPYALIRERNVSKCSGDLPGTKPAA